MEPVQLEVTSIEYNGDEETAYIVYQGDPQVYDSGKMLTVVYGRNENEPDAIENRILDCEEDGDGKEHAVLDALDEVLPSISYFYPTVTRITLETVEGNLTAAITEDVDAIVPHLPIPQHLSHISTLPITELWKVATLAMDVDRVKWEGHWQTFAFKKTGEVLTGTLRELTILDRLCKSPNIIGLKAIVVNRENLIRGFLMPYMFAGNLEHVLIKARQDQGVAEDDDEPIFDWPIKLTWAPRRSPKTRST
jgi:hypothetical protein